MPSNRRVPYYYFESINQPFNNQLMNKILRYSLSLVLALVASVTFAAEPYKVLTFPDDGTEGTSFSDYTTTWQATIGDDSWTIANFNSNKWANNWKYIKCGSKKNASVASITSPAIDKAVSYVVVTIDAVTKANVNSIKLQVSSDEAFTSVSEEVAASDIATGDLVFKTTKAAANDYYKVVFDCKKGSNNGIVQVSKVAYYKEGDAPTIVDITNTPETAYTVAKAKELIDAGEGLATSVYVKGKVSKASENLNEIYGSLSYYISDDGTTDNELEVYGGLSFKGEKFTSVDDIKVGDEVVVYGQLKMYGTTYELDKNNILFSKNGATGINKVVADEANANAPVYNLSGQRVGKNAKGVLIKNGKKYVVK